MLDAHLAKVEKHGFDRSIFPLSYNGHALYLLHNDAYSPDRDGRLQIHITLHCARCEMEYTMYGRAASDLDWTKNHVQDIKVAALYPFVKRGCSG